MGKWGDWMRQLLLCDATQPDKVGEICQRNGLGVEIQAFSNPDYPLREPNAVGYHLSAYKSVTPRSLHGPFGDLSPGSCDRLIRQVTKERFEFAYEYAQKLGAKQVVLHHGYVPGTNTHRSWLRRSREFLVDFLEGKDPEINFYLENLLEPDPELLGAVVREVNRPNLKICLDIGHAFCHGKLPVERWVEELGDLIGYVHFHDNHGDKDDHLSLGKGRIPLDQVCYSLESLAPDATWALEVGPDSLEDSIFWLESHGYLPNGGE